jgi:hypothetical protein
MHDRVITETVRWIESNVGETTTTQEIVDKMEGSDLPESAKQVLAELPDGEHRKEDVVSWAEQGLLSRLGAAHQTMRGFGGSM